MSVKDQMIKLYGTAGMIRPPSRHELYVAVELITEAIKGNKDRLDSLEAGKPKVRVQAGRAAR